MKEDWLSIQIEIRKFLKREQIVQVEKFLGEFPENLGIVEYPKSEPFNPKILEISGEKSNGTEIPGRPRKVVLFSGNSGKCCSIRP